MLPREDVERKITVVAVVAVKEAAFLLAMNRVVGRIQVHHHLLGRRVVGLHECIHHPAVDPVRVHRDLLVSLLFIDLGSGQLQPVQRTLARQRLPPIPACRRVSPNGSALFTATASIGSVRN